MRYVRTKDGIFETIGKEQHCRDGEIEVFCTKHNSVAKSWIIAQADTIEELCDGLIVEDKNNTSLWFVMEMDELKNEKEHLTGWNYNAFIKTGRGLIYVAKMNENGELKLL